VESARSAVYYAAWALGGGVAEPDRVACAVLLAQARALEGLHTAAAEAVQVHGGTAITWEHDIQLYFKRAVADQLLFGAPHRLRAQAAARVGLFAPTAHRSAHQPAHGSEHRPVVARTSGGAG